MGSKRQYIDFKRLIFVNIYIQRILKARISHSIAASLKAPHIWSISTSSLFHIKVSKCFILCCQRILLMSRILLFLYWPMRCIIWYIIRIIIWQESGRLAWELNSRVIIEIFTKTDTRLIHRIYTSYIIGDLRFLIRFKLYSWGKTHWLLLHSSAIHIV